MFPHFGKRATAILVLSNIFVTLVSGKSISEGNSDLGLSDPDSSLNGSSPLIFPIPFVNEIVEYYTKEFGQPCNKYDKCDYRFWLSCRNETCQCQKGEIFYDETRNLCVAKVGTGCKRKVRLDDEGVLVKVEDVNRLHQISQTVENNILYDVIECPAHAFCDGRLCHCESGYYTDPENGICLKQKEIHQQCQNDIECKSASIFQCLEGKCSCQEPRKYDAQIDKCVVSVSTGNCSVTVSGEEDCPKDSRCLNGSCICNDGYAITSNRKCARGYRQSCSKENPCSDIFLACRNKMCDCQFPYHQYYKEDEKRCVSLVGGYCTVSEEPYKSVECTENANCSFNEFYNECVCHSGYIENALGKCSKSYGMLCKENSECDRAAQLECINGFCHCPDKLRVYDKRLKICVALVGSKCFYNAQDATDPRHGVVNVNMFAYPRRFSPSLTPRMYKHPFNNRIYLHRDTVASFFYPLPVSSSLETDEEDFRHDNNADVSNFCVEGASCVPNNPYNTQDQHNGKCVCNSFYVPLPNRTCNMD